MNLVYVHACISVYQPLVLASYIHLVTSFEFADLHIYVSECVCVCVCVCVNVCVCVCVCLYSCTYTSLYCFLIDVGITSTLNYHMCVCVLHIHLPHIFLMKAGENKYCKARTFVYAHIPCMIHSITWRTHTHTRHAWMLPPSVNTYMQSHILENSYKKTRMQITPFYATLITHMHMHKHTCKRSHMQTLICKATPFSTPTHTYTSTHTNNLISRDKQKHNTHTQAVPNPLLLSSEKCGKGLQCSETKRRPGLS